MNIESKPSILYIEDDPNNRLLLKLILEKNGYKFYEAENGLKGVKIAKEQNIDLILLDINMQGMNGYETATRIKSFEKYKNKPLIAVTGSAAKNSKDLALISGCDGFIKKPINISNIINQIKEYLNGKKEEVKQTKFYELLREYNIQLVSHLEREILELHRANTDLKEIDNLKSNFISLASHEIKTPLTSIIGFVRLLISNKPNISQKNFMNMLKEIKVNALKLEDIFNDILTISCLENNILFLKTTKNVSIINIINAILDSLKNILDEQKIKINLKTSKKIPLIECDIDKIYLAISNIIKYSCNDLTNKEINILLNYPSKNVLKKHEHNPKNFIEILIDYNCKNTTLNKINKIFEKFTEPDDINKHNVSNNEFLNEGIGLHLSIAKGIINKHNGYVWTEKKDNNTIVFKIALPYDSQ